jgi:hypothetical protein
MDGSSKKIHGQVASGKKKEKERGRASTIGKFPSPPRERGKKSKVNLFHAPKKTRKRANCTAFASIAYPSFSLSHTTTRRHTYYCAKHMIDQRAKKRRELVIARTYTRLFCRNLSVFVACSLLLSSYKQRLFLLHVNRAISLVYAFRIKVYSVTSRV